MSSESHEVNPYYVKMLNEIEKKGGVSEILKSSHPKFKILKTAKGARIQASLSIGGLSNELQSFMINSYKPKKNINHEQVRDGDRFTSTFTYLRDVSDNYLKDAGLNGDAKVHTSKLFFAPLDESKENLIAHVKGTGFPGGPFSSPTVITKADSAQKDEGAIRRFLNKVLEHAPSFG
ncbi:hypothetical protein [Psychromonas sp. SP041]|uniref:hypothetical protein n=1 Tax=Psychromonas sp. SP041 TaxID=1365007 RepID=UPI0010C781DD|nr:hypothetical protein [Psychromonas sp. SP041]